MAFGNTSNLPMIATLAGDLTPGPFMALSAAGGIRPGVYAGLGGCDCATVAGVRVSAPFRDRPRFARCRSRSCLHSNSPKGLRRIALGCREAQRSGYPGDAATTTESTLKGLCNVAPPLRNPFGVNVSRRPETQGSRCATTLGYPTKSLRDNRDATSSLEADSLFIELCMANEPSTLGWQLYCHPFPGAAVQLPHQRGFINSAKLNRRRLAWRRIALRRQAPAIRRTHTSEGAHLQPRFTPHAGLRTPDPRLRAGKRQRSWGRRGTASHSHKSESQLSAATSSSYSSSDSVAAEPSTVCSSA
jgi:hypothetical protein